MKRTILFLFLALSVGIGCGEAKPLAVRGTVTLDGAAMSNGEISFGLPGQPPTIVPIVAGAFEVSVAPGDYRVEIRAYRPSERPPGVDASVPLGQDNYLPERFNSMSELRAEVTRSGPNKFDFAVQSKP